MFTRFIKQVAYRCNIEIRRVDKSENQPKVSTADSSNNSTMMSALRRLQGVGVTPDGIVDIGAAVGAWSAAAMKVWPDAEYLLIEPLQEQIDRMSDIRHLSNVSLRQAVAGNSDDEIDFGVTEDLDGSGVYGHESDNTRKVSQIRLADESFCRDKKQLLLKLDTHGYEIPILEGSRELLPRVSAFVIEVYGFHVSPTGRLFHEMSDYLAHVGFRLFDVVDILRREKDQAFWQADAVFIPSIHPLFVDNTYR